ncbi:hypothetical protein LINPERPRIM_LOCUS24781, partial [Linum perenne]
RREEGKLARLCFEVDLSKPFLYKYHLRRRVQRIEYEGLHTICYSCGCFCHTQEVCVVNQEEVEVAELDVVISNPIFQSEILDEARPEIDEDFGPWLKVKRKARRSKPSSD